MNELRRFFRLKTGREGLVTLPDGTMINCKVVNFSFTGACLEIDEGVQAVPETFMLVIKPKFLARTSEVCWREGGKIGVRFV